MGRRGPKPEPAAIKKQKASSRRPVGQDVPEAQAAENVKTSPAIIAPDWLKADGLAVWDRLAPRLLGQKILTQVDSETFGRYCRNFARWLKMQAILDDEGETYESESPHGTYKRANPAYMIADRLERQLVSAEANFGLNPAERQRLFAARAAGSLGDLFNNEQPASGSATRGQKTDQAKASSGAVGFLN